jgi:hypothetical protein
MKRYVMTWILLLTLLALISCTAGANTMQSMTAPEGSIAGFWSGLWHGFIAVFTFIISWFSDSVGVYEIHNNGFWYNLGFLIGASAFFGGGGNQACRRKG